MVVNWLRALNADRLWQHDPAQQSRPKRLLYGALQLVAIAARGFREDGIRLQAMALSFKLLISLAPLLAVSFSVLKAFEVQSRLLPVLAEFLSPLGPAGREISERVVAFVDNIKVGALGSVGVGILFVTVLALMANIEEAFNEIWEVKHRRTLLRKFTDYLSTLVVGPILVFSALAVTGSLQSHHLVQKLIALEPFGTILVMLMRVAPYLAVWGAFTFLYLFIPNTRVRFRSALLGGLVAALLWQTGGWAFTAFVVTSTKTHVLYSSFAILFVFFLWVYVGWLIVLSGAEVAFAHQNLGSYAWERKSAAASAAAKEWLALKIMILIGDHFFYGRPPWSIPELGRSLNASSLLVGELLELLGRSGLLIATAGAGSYVPSRDLQRISVKEVLDAVRNHGDPVSKVAMAAAPDEPASALLGTVDREVARALDGKTLKHLVEAQGAAGCSVSDRG